VNSKPSAHVITVSKLSGENACAMERAGHDGQSVGAQGIPNAQGLANPVWSRVVIALVDVSSQNEFFDVRPGVPLEPTSRAME
jgi:hypothetical protein